MYFLPSVDNYRHMDTQNYHLYGDTKDCDDLVGELHEDFDGVEDFCMRTTGILNRFDMLKLNTTNDQDKCEIVNYWIYHNLLNKIEMKRYIDPLAILYKISAFRKKIHKSPEGDHKKEKCAILIELYDKNIFEKMKILFDYITDYDTIKLNIGKSDFACSEQYKNYINNGVSTYKSIKEECDGDRDKEKYCKLLIDINTKHSDKKLAELQCLRYKSTDVSPPSARVSEKQVLDTYPPAPGEDQPALQGHTEEFSPGTVQKHAPYVAHLLARDHPSFSPPRDANQLSTAEGESPPPPKGAFMTTVFPTIGSLFFFSMIYKVNKNNLSKYKNIYCY
ncbi:hypothetical protein PVMG_05632 [Plasmodium vivax Mauritania I]|uniref:Uncharacterized protein n=1 Tax=Plasmodium vivax Mauritania I TaxID=1035515 RepID=A0A0J9W3S4_PLAVI|nr:hypothetical protein PVMG_05632 [Plasmodium vivax Mauritania I]